MCRFPQKNAGRFLPKWWTWWWWCSMLWLLLPILITVRSPDSGSNRLWMGADRGLSMGGNFRLRRRSTGPMGPFGTPLLADGAGADRAAGTAAGAFEVGRASAWSGSLARMMSTSGPQVLNRPLASSMVRPRSDLPFTLIISSPKRNLPSLEKQNRLVTKLLYFPYYAERALKSPQKFQTPSCSSANFLGSRYILSLKSKSYYEIWTS